MDINSNTNLNINEEGDEESMLTTSEDTLNNNSNSKSRRKSSIQKKHLQQEQNNDESFRIDDDKNENQENIMIVNDKIEEDGIIENNQLLNDNNQQLVERMIQGKLMIIDKFDYEKYIKYGKWSFSLFFKYDQTSSEKRECNFCQSKCNTIIDNVYLCANCKEFAQKTLSKHINYTCKNDVKLCIQPKSSLESKYCRYCHFYAIFNSLERLKKYEKYLVEFFNKTILFINSAKYKSMKNKLLNNNNNTNNNNEKNNINDNSVLIQDQLIENDDNIKMETELISNETEIISNIREILKEETIVKVKHESPKRKEPRVKQVSRRNPFMNNINDDILLNFNHINHLYLKKSLESNCNLLKLSAFNIEIDKETLNEYFNQLKVHSDCNNDDDDNRSQSSVLSEHSENDDDEDSDDDNDQYDDTDLISYEQKYLTYLKIFKTKCSSTTGSLSPIPSDFDTKLIKYDTIAQKQQQLNSQFNKTNKSKEYRELTTSSSSNNQKIKQPKIVFNYLDDFFDKYHRISTSQNYKYSLSKDSQEVNQLSSVKEISLNEDTIKSERLKFKGIQSQTSTTATTTSSAYNQSTQFNLFNNYNYLIWDMKIDYDIYEIWKHGYPIISAQQIYMKSACYLCASYGNPIDDLIYCNVCCEPYHVYCIEDYERPKLNTNRLDWICPACKFCDLCGKQNDLLHCNMCENAYHANCFKRLNYPKKATKKQQIWICFNCFNCKCCGSDNINFDYKQYLKLPNYDFKFCFDCEKQLNDNNACKLCIISSNNDTKLMNDDDFQSSTRLLTCSQCTCPIHAKCALIPNEDYFILVDNNLNYICSLCDSTFDYNNEVIKFKNKQLLIVLEELKNSLRAVVDESVNFDDLFKDIEAKLKQNSYSFLKYFIDDFNRINDIRFDSQLLLSIQCNLIEIIREKFPKFNPESSDPKLELLKLQTKSTGHKNKTLTFNRLKLTNDMVKMLAYDDHTYALNALLNTINQEQTKKLKEKEKEEENKSKDFNLDSNWSNFMLNEDTRKCFLCLKSGDSAISGRILSYDVYWIHLNCALWSAQDIQINDHLVEQVHMCISKFKHQICSVCKLEGATLQCKFNKCDLNYHYECAHKSQCTFNYSNKTIICKIHEEENELKRNEPLENHCYILNIDGYRKKYLSPIFTYNSINILIGSLRVESLGDIDLVSDSEDTLFPIDYRCTRVYWSTRQIGKKVLYKCTIKKKYKQFNRIFNENRTLAHFIDDNMQLDGNNDELLLVDNQKPSSNNNIIAQCSDLSTLLRIVSSTTAVTHNNYTIKILNNNNNNNNLTTNTTSQLITTNRQQNDTINNNGLTIRIDKSGIRGGGISSVLNSASTSSTNGLSMLSPKSDKSDSSLNLTDFSASMLINPLLQSCYDDLDQQLQVMQGINPLTTQRQQQKQLPQVLNKISSNTNLVSPATAAITTSSPSTSSTSSSASAKPLSDLEKDWKHITNSKLKQTISNRQIVNNKTKDALITKCSKSRSTVTIKQLLSEQYNHQQQQQQQSVNLTQQIESPISLAQISAIQASTEQQDEITKAIFDDQLKTKSSIKLNNNQSRQQTSKQKRKLNDILNDNSYDLEDKKKIFKYTDDFILNSPIEIHQELKENQPKLVEEESNREEKQDEEDILVATESNEPLIELDNDENDCELVFEITSDEGISIQSSSINDVWKQLTQKVNELRVSNGLKRLSHEGINGTTMFGLNNKTVCYLLEQFDSVQYCTKYKVKYYQSKILTQSTNTNWKIDLNHSARTKSHQSCQNIKKDYFKWLNKKNDDLKAISLSRQFDDAFIIARKTLLTLDISNSMKYRHLKTFSKQALVVKRSPIHGRGLFTLVDLTQGQMIIEYSGEIIRNQLCDKRERDYELKGIGCYMFRIDEHEIIDATTKGNQARFINHSCEPNCLSKVLIIHGRKHIIIYAAKNIDKGEELTYDYQFPKEDIKIECLCKSFKCRKYLN